MILLDAPNSRGLTLCPGLSRSLPRGTPPALPQRENEEPVAAARRQFRRHRLQPNTSPTGKPRHAGRGDHSSPRPGHRCATEPPLSRRLRGRSGPYAPPRPVLGRLDPVAREVAFVQSEQLALGRLSDRSPLAGSTFVRVHSAMVPDCRLPVHGPADYLADDRAERGAVAQPEGIGLSERLPDGGVTSGRAFVRPDEHVPQQVDPVQLVHAEHRLGVEGARYVGERPIARYLRRCAAAGPLRLRPPTGCWPGWRGAHLCLLAELDETPGVEQRVRVPFQPARIPGQVDQQPVQNASCVGPGRFRRHGRPAHLSEMRSLSGREMEADVGQVGIEEFPAVACRPPCRGWLTKISPDPGTARRERHGRRSLGVGSYATAGDRPLVRRCRTAGKAADCRLDDVEFPFRHASRHPWSLGERGRIAAAGRARRAVLAAPRRPPPMQRRRVVAYPALSSSYATPSTPLRLSSGNGDTWSSNPGSAAVPVISSLDRPACISLRVSSSAAVK